jgi:vacuolar-type H+-ATPase subunit C/Vma6
MCLTHSYIKMEINRSNIKTVVKTSSLTRLTLDKFPTRIENGENLEFPNTSFPDRSFDIQHSERSQREKEEEAKRRE